MNIKDIAKLVVLIPPIVVTVVLFTSSRKPRADGVGNAVYTLLNDLPQYQKPGDLEKAILIARSESKSEDEKHLIELSNDVFKSILFTPKKQNPDCTEISKNRISYGLFSSAADVVSRHCSAKTAGQVLRCSVDFLTAIEPNGSLRKKWEGCLRKWDQN